VVRRGRPPARGRAASLFCALPGWILGLCCL